MQRVFAVGVSADARFALSGMPRSPKSLITPSSDGVGSEDTNVRIWKMEASKSLAVVAGRKERKERLRDALKRRYAQMPEIKRIVRDKKVPKAIKKAVALNHVQNTSKKRKLENQIRHSTPGTVQVVPERKRVVIKELE